MKNLLATLHDYDPGMLPALAETWGVDAKRLSNDALIRQLEEAMLDADQLEAAWDKLDDQARAALQLLVSAQGRMKVGQFERFYGEIRKLGRAQIARESPHVAGQSLAETLYYRGFIGEGFDKVGERLLGFIYVPSDLIAALPLHKTSYENLEALPANEPDQPPRVGLVDDIDDVSRADTSIVDDLASLLAWAQADELSLEAGRLTERAAEMILPSLLAPSPERLAFLLGIAISAQLIEIDAGQASPRRDEARDWLKAPRAEQIKTLASAWLESQSYRDMWHIPGLYPEDSGWSYDARAARQALIDLLSDLLPEQGWVSINDLIETIKEFEPDFQRANGDYDRWYIRNEAGEYLSGFESWDAVEGSLIEFCIACPMHWLGLVDIGEDVMRLTAYGRAFLQLADWPPRQSEQRLPIEARHDGKLLVSRRVDRFERFQLARFANCAAASDPYIYSIDAASIRRAADQGISAQHIQSFLSRHLDGKPLPPPLAKLLRNWQDGVTASVSFESHIVLRATSSETVDKLFAVPALRRFLGARLGPTACVVLADQWGALQAELGELAIAVDISRLDVEGDSQ